MKAVRLALVLAAAAALAGGCGDNNNGGNHGDGGNGDGRNGDGGIDSSPGDGSIDTPGETTFTAFVIDLVQNRTADNTDPVPYAMFSGLNDTDGDNATAYASLFN